MPDNKTTASKQKKDSSWRQKSLLQLYKIDSDNMEKTLHKITEVAANTINVDRVSVWFMDEKGLGIDCKDIYYKSASIHEQVSHLNSEDYPRYFKALKDNGIIAVSDATGDPTTSELAQSYLKPLGISSLLDVSIWLHGSVVGVVSFEHTGETREWTSEEQYFANSIADIVSLFIKISEHRKVESILRESRRSYSTLISNLPGVVYRYKNDTGSKWTLEYISDGCLPLTGYSPDDFLKNNRVSFSDVINPEDLANIWNKIHIGINNKKPYQLEYRIITAKGKEKWVWEQGRAIDNNGDNEIYLEGFITDITRRKKGDKALKESEETLRVIFNSVNDAIFIHDGEGRIFEVNDRMLKMYGVNRKEAKKYTVQDDYSDSSNHIDSLKEIWQKVLSGKPQTLKWKARRPKDGGVFDVDVYLCHLSLRGKDFILATVSDVTIKNKVEADLRESEERFRGILASIEEAYYEVDIEGNLTYCNEAAQRFLGYSINELIGMNYREVYKDWKSVYSVFNRVFRTGKPDKGFTLEVTRKDGSVAYGELSVSLMYDHHGRISGFRGVGRDVTERIQFEDKLKYLSFHDQLTGIYNRAFFEEELRRLEEGRDYPISIISADLDGLKLMNDAMGHKHGDDLLKACTDVLKSGLRKSDIISRIGGDEFAIILPRTDDWIAEKVVARINKNIASYNKQTDDVFLSISLGVGTAQEKGSSLEETLREADNYMYREKINRSFQVYDQMVGVFLNALEKKDYMKEGHGRRMEEMCHRLGKRLKLSSRQITDLTLLAKVHDLGKVGIPDSILMKKDPLSEDEWESIKEHSEKGYRIALSIRKYTSVADLILRHHEWWDGNGYPTGLKGENIPIECRILTIADAFDAMTNKRPYRKAISRAKALEELNKRAGTQFDPNLLPLFTTMIEEEDNAIL